MPGVPITPGEPPRTSCTTCTRPRVKWNTVHPVGPSSYSATPISSPGKSKRSSRVILRERKRRRFARRAPHSPRRALCSGRACGRRSRGEGARGRTASPPVRSLLRPRPRRALARSAARRRRGFPAAAARRGCRHRRAPSVRARRRPPPARRPPSPPAPRRRCGSTSELHLDERHGSPAPERPHVRAGAAKTCPLVHLDRAFVELRDVEDDPLSAEMFARKRDSPTEELEPDPAPGQVRAEPEPDLERGALQLVVVEADELIVFVTHREEALGILHRLLVAVVEVVRRLVAVRVERGDVLGGCGLDAEFHVRGSVTRLPPRITTARRRGLDTTDIQSGGV